MAPNYYNQISCLHCIYYLNYCNKEVIDGVYGATIFEYIAMCKDDHDVKLCLRENCVICDEINLDNIKKLSDSEEEKIIVYI